MFFLKKKYQKYQFKDLYNKQVILEYGANSYVDPDIVADTPDSIIIGSNTIIRKGVVFRPESGEIRIGDNCVINHYCAFHGKGGIHIGDWVIVGPHCGFYAQNHSYGSFDLPITKQENVGKGIYLMGDNWIGGHSVLCDDVTLGKGAVVGANSTVIHSVPMGTITAGSPAKIVKKRYNGEWDFNKVERASRDEMPQQIYQHVLRRGAAIGELLKSSDTVLEIGCGEGVMISAIKQKTKNITGCDYSIEALQLAKDSHPEITFVHSNCTNLKFSNNQFTKVVLSDVAEHLLPIQLVKTLREIKRVLADNGHLVLTTPITGKGKNTSTYSHIYEYSREEIENILSSTFSAVTFVNEEFGIFIAQNKI